MNELNELVVYDTIISLDQDGYVSLTDLWRVAGKDFAKRPWQWQRLPTTKELVAALSQKGGFSAFISKTRTKSAIYTTRGRDGSTYAHHILALAYAEYLNPDLGIEVRDIALRFWAGDLTLLDDFAHNRRKQFEEDEKRVTMRDETRWYNQVLAVHAKKAGAYGPSDFAEFHNSGYRGLYNGEDENAIHRRKQLLKDQAILDHMTSPEAAANWFRTTQTEQGLKYGLHFKARPTLKDACLLHHKIGKRIRDVMKEFGSPMPENMPVADSIAAAKKRLKIYRKGPKKRAIAGSLQSRVALGSPAVTAPDSLVGDDKPKTS